MSHTPGPWTLRPMSMNIDGYGVESLGEEKSICTGTKAINDARLIAAAPEMLAALEELVVLLEDVRSGDYKVDYFTAQPAQQAIAKAKGES